MVVCLHGNMSFVQNMILNNKVKDKNLLDSVMISSKHLIPPPCQQSQYRKSSRSQETINYFYTTICTVRVTVLISIGMLSNPLFSIRHISQLRCHNTCAHSIRICLISFEMVPSTKTNPSSISTIVNPNERGSGNN